MLYKMYYYIHNSDYKRRHRYSIDEYKKSSQIKKS